MKASRWLAVGLLGGGILAAAAQTDPTPMPIPTPTIETPTATFAPPTVWLSPTPDETGAINVIVQTGESMWVIAARAGLSLAELLALNNRTENDVINPGDVLLIGRATPPSTPTADIPTPTLPPPTLRPTEPLPEAAICLTAFDDLDRDGVHDSGEPLRAGVAFTIYTTEAVVANYITDGVSEPRCLRGLLPGEYRVTRSIAPGETLTTGGDWTLSLTEGSELRQAFGSIIGVAATATPAVAAAGAPAAGQAAPATAAAPPPEASMPQPTVPGLDWRIAGVFALFLGGLLLMGAVLILLFRQPRGETTGERGQDPADERRFRDLDDL